MFNTKLKNTVFLLNEKYDEIWEVSPLENYQKEKKISHNYWMVFFFFLKKTIVKQNVKPKTIFM